MEVCGERLLRPCGIRPQGYPERHGTGGARALVELREVPGARRVPRRGLLGLYHYAILLPSRTDLGRFLVHLGGPGESFGAWDHLFSAALYLTHPHGTPAGGYAD